jgi:hypothetical protein
MSFTLSYIFFSVVHIVGFALALTVCGLYGKDLSRANEQDKYADSKWVSAAVRRAKLSGLLQFATLDRRLIWDIHRSMRLS